MTVVPVAKVVQVETVTPGQIKGMQIPSGQALQSVVVTRFCQLYGPVPPDTVILPFNSAQTVNVAQALTVILIVLVPQGNV